MAGHSHWAQIKHQKAANDAKKGKLFTKMAKAITYAAKKGGGDPNFNPTLADAIRQARAVSVSKDTIDKAIKKGTGTLEGGAMEEVMYEGYGPAGEAYLIKVLTDNKNRTVSDLRHIFSKHNGSLGTTGSAAYIFGEGYVPSFTLPINDPTLAQTVLKLAETLDDYDDVQEIFANFEIPDSLNIV
jgi:YebC/PmpR family DNA-binding regulatory protein